VKTQSYAVNGKDIDRMATSEAGQYRADTFGTKEPEALAWVDKYFRNADVFYDIRANVELYSLPAATAFPELSVHTVEQKSSRNSARRASTWMRNPAKCPRASSSEHSLRASTMPSSPAKPKQVMHGRGEARQPEDA